LIASGLAVSFPFIWSNFIDQFHAHIYEALVVFGCVESLDARHSIPKIFTTARQLTDN